MGNETRINSERISHYMKELMGILPAHYDLSKIPKNSRIVYRFCPTLSILPENTIVDNVEFHDKNEKKILYESGKYGDIRERGLNFYKNGINVLDIGDFIGCNLALKVPIHRKKIKTIQFYDNHIEMPVGNVISGALNSNELFLNIEIDLIDNDYFRFNMDGKDELLIGLEKKLGFMDDDFYRSEFEWQKTLILVKREAIIRYSSKS